MKDINRSNTVTSAANQQMKEELREWIQYDPLQALVKETNIIYYPSMYEFTSAASSPPLRVTKGALSKAVDITAPKSAPLYLQLDGPEKNTLRISLNMLDPRVLFNSGIPIVDYIEPAYLVLERFEWFVDCEIPIAKAFVRTRGYNSVEVDFQPGRHFCRIWIHSRMNWHIMLLSESTLLLGTRDIIQGAAARECPWASRFLSALGSAFSNWIRVNRSNPNIVNADREFFKSYQPDLPWDPVVVGYDKSLLHWMFRQALQSLLFKRLQQLELRPVCMVLRRYFCDPDFGIPPKPAPPKSLREIIALDLCDCLMPQAEEVEILEEQMEEQVPETKPTVDQITMEILLTAPDDPMASHVCELATEELPCGILKDERERVIRRHEAATCIQAHWRGSWARKCLNSRVTFTPEIYKIIMESAFGNLDSLSALMNEFFGLYPNAKYAYSVASALKGAYGLEQHSGTCHITPKCKWIPYFQGVFYCHGQVKVHFDVQSTLQFNSVAVYNNDNGHQMPQAYNAHVTFDIKPNQRGYTVMGHGTLNQPSGVNQDSHWQLTVMSSIEDFFHICDNDFDICKELSLPPTNKPHIDEIFLPNRRNILGGIQVTVSRYEAISFRAAASSPDVEMVAILRTLSSEGVMEEIAQCEGKGELYWPYIRLKPARLPELLSMKKKSTSHSNLSAGPRDAVTSARSLRSPAKSLKPASAGKSRSTTKIKDQKLAPLEPKQYFIQVVASNGWPLTLAQWQRVDEVRNSQEYKLDLPSKKPAKEKASSARDRDKTASPTLARQPLPGDAYTELECSLAVGGGAYARRDDARDLEFIAARKSWDAHEVGRNLRGAQIRKEFRTEFLEALPVPPSDSIPTFAEEMIGEYEGEEQKKDAPQQTQQGPTPVSESGMLEMSMESEEEAKYLMMPEQLRDKFIPLYFLPFCTKEIIEEMPVLETPDMAEAAKNDRHARIEAALERMNDLQNYNLLQVLGRQKTRCQLLEKLYIDSQWPQELLDVLDERDEAIARETLNRTLSATKKKVDAKKK